MLIPAPQLQPGRPTRAQRPVRRPFPTSQRELVAASLLRCPDVFDDDSPVDQAWDRP